LEYQERGAPHYHIILGLTYVPYDYIARIWYEIVGSGDEAHLAAGTRVEAIRSRNGVLYYASKYCAKVSGAPLEETGRVWGVVGRRHLPVDVVREGDLSDDQLMRLIAEYRRRGLDLYDGQVTFHLFGAGVADYLDD